jgi:hypothetical protein
MSTSPKAVRFDEDTLWVSLSDGRTIAAPLAWFPRLLEAAPEQRAQVELSKPPGDLLIEPHQTVANGRPVVA